MTTAFYLLPGARLPRGAAAEVLERLAPDVRAALERLGTGREPPGLQRLSEPLHEYSPHRAWLWKVLTHRQGAPVLAPYAWLAEGAPRLDQAFWALDAWTQSPEGRFARLELPETALPKIACAADAALRARGLRLMISGRRLFAARRELFDFAARPFEDLCGMEAAHFGHLAHLTSGADAPAVLDLLEELKQALTPVLGDALRGLWLSGGGFAEPVFPPSTFRSVAADDPVALAWAEAAGIPRSALGRFTGRTAWPDAPAGDRIAVLPHLYEAWLKHDWAEWSRALPEALEALHYWRGLEKAAGIDACVLVLFGHAGAATLLPEKRGALGLFRRAAKQPLESWLIDSEEER